MRIAEKIRETHFVYRSGKPSAVILDIGVYREMLERLEDSADLNTLKKMRKHRLRFRPLEDFLREYHSGV